MEEEFSRLYVEGFRSGIAGGRQQVGGFVTDPENWGAIALGCWRVKIMGKA